GYIATTLQTDKSYLVDPKIQRWNTITGSCCGTIQFDDIRRCVADITKEPDTYGPLRVMGATLFSTQVKDTRTGRRCLFGHQKRIVRFLPLLCHHAAITIGEEPKGAYAVRISSLEEGLPCLFKASPH